MAGRIEITAQAKAHPLFPTLDYIIRTVRSNQTMLNTMTSTISKVEDTCSRIENVQKDLEKLIKEFGEDAFNIENTPYQVYACIKSVNNNYNKLKGEDHSAKIIDYSV